MSGFNETLMSLEMELPVRGIETLQLNITRLCNQACAHCHVGASPARREMMDRETIDRCIGIVDSHDEINTVDITGGAPELHPDFRYLVRALRELGRRVIVRHNLTVTLDPHPIDNSPMSWLPEFFTDSRVELVSSLPHYQPYLTDRQRGDHVFEKSIESMRLLNVLGYGHEGSGLVLNLVHNPVGPYLPTDQCALERDYRNALGELHGVVFDNLYAITNVPVRRFAERLGALGEQESYLARLASAFNPAAATNVMCRNQVSVGYDGTLYDCDFNQMLDLAIDSCHAPSVFEFDRDRLAGRRIRFADHCFACAAGAGSSCGGTTA